jgi:two-component sensor histidine kinase
LHHAAPAVGTAIHQLTANALKFGALSAAEGRVDIDLRAEWENFVLDRIERNAPPVTSPEHLGFGVTSFERGPLMLYTARERVTLHSSG